ncbi:MAG: sigma-E factor negative regulatory protein [Rubrivivax sp.]|nr:sigma-E factor negative regulatory protein [Rubrivivax sp.]
MNNEPPVDAGDARRWLSAIADGEADDAELGRGLAAWAGDDRQLRQTWHTYHLIGDVLRSEDLASPPGRDRDFLQRLQARLDDEPAVLVPRPRPSPPGSARRRAWVWPVAAAAGVSGLASALVLSLGSKEGDAGAPLLARAPVAASVALAPASADAAEAVPPGGRVLRDARLDSYLRAHRDYAMALPGSLPGGSGRSITTVSLDR